jgi:hypothetical protein
MTSAFARVHTVHDTRSNRSIIARTEKSLQPFEQRIGIFFSDPVRCPRHVPFSMTRLAGRGLHLLHRVEDEA